MNIQDLYQRPDVLQEMGLVARSDDGGDYGLFDADTMNRVNDKSLLQSALDQFDSRNSKGQLVYGTAGPQKYGGLRFFGGEGLDVNGSPHSQFDASYDDIMSNPQYADFARKAGITPDDFSYDDTYGMLIGDNDRVGNFRQQLHDYTQQQNEGGMDRLFSNMPIYMGLAGLGAGVSGAFASGAGAAGTGADVVVSPLADVGSVVGTPLDMGAEAGLEAGAGSGALTSPFVAEAPVVGSPLAEGAAATAADAAAPAAESVNPAELFKDPWDLQYDPGITYSTPEVNGPSFLDKLTSKLTDIPGRVGDSFGKDPLGTALKLVTMTGLLTGKTGGISGNKSTTSTATPQTLGAINTSPLSRVRTPVTNFKRYGFGPSQTFFNNVAGLSRGGRASAASPIYGPAVTGALSQMTRVHKAPGGLSQQDPRHVQGPGGGQDDKIPAMLSDGEYIFSAQDVSDLGDGSNMQGAKKLDELRTHIRKNAGRKNVNDIAPKQPSALSYFKTVK